MTIYASFWSQFIMHKSFKKNYITNLSLEKFLFKLEIIKIWNEVFLKKNSNIKKCKRFKGLKT